MRLKIVAMLIPTAIAMLIIGFIIGGLVAPQQARPGQISVIDALGRIVTFDSPPKRVVSLAPSITETLFALGLGDRVVGVTRFCNHPPDVLRLVNEGRITVIGGYWNPDVEKIIALKPDLVIGSAGTRPHLDLRERLEGLGIRVLYVKGSGAVDVNEILVDIVTIARVFGVEDRALELSKNISDTVNDVRNRLAGVNISKPKVLQLAGPPSLGLWSSGGNTFIGWIISVAGGINIAQRFSGWPQLDYEYIRVENPDVIIVNTMGGEDVASVVKDIEESPLSETKAFKEGRVYILTDEANDILLRPGPRVGQAVKLVAQLLYPEIFGRPEVRGVYKVEGSQAIALAPLVVLVEAS